MRPVPPPALSARLARLIGGLCAAVGARVAGPARPGLAGPLIILIWTRLQRMAGRVARLAARVEAGTLTPPRSHAATKRRTAPPPYQRLPRGFAWLVRLVPAAASGATQLQALLDDPEMKNLIAAAPRIGRTLRPLCRALGVQPPPILQEPEPAPPRAAVAVAPPPTSPRTAPAAGPRQSPAAPKPTRSACGPPLPAPA